MEIAETHLGHDHGITITIRSSYIAAKRAVAARRSKRRIAEASSIRKGGARGHGARGARERASRHAAGSRVSPTKAEEKRWETISSAYGDIPGVTPVRAEHDDDVSPQPSPGAGAAAVANTSVENPEAGADEELPAAAAAAVTHGVRVEGSGGGGAGGKTGEAADQAKVAKGPGLQNLDDIVGGQPDLGMMISPRPGAADDKAAGDAGGAGEGKVETEGKEGKGDE